MDAFHLSHLPSSHETEILHVCFTYFFCVTNTPIINPKMLLTLNQELKCILIESVLNDNKKAIQDKKHCEKYHGY